MWYPLLKGGTLSVEDKRDCVESCREDKRLDDHCYYWSTARKSWEDSELYCQHMKGHLAAVTSLDFQNFLKKVNKDEVKTWVGGSERGRRNMDMDRWQCLELLQLGRQPAKQGNKSGLSLYYSRRQFCKNKCQFHYYFICSQRLCPGINLIINMKKKIYI